MLETGACADVAQLGLHHRAQVAGCVMTKLNDLAGLPLEDYDHAASNLCCRNCHKKRSISVSKKYCLLELAARAHRWSTWLVSKPRSLAGGCALCPARLVYTAEQLKLKSRCVPRRPRQPDSLSGRA